MNQEEKWLLQEKYQGAASQDFFADLKKLKNGYPLAYLIGNIPFLNLKIYLDSKPLIPRTETEFWVDLVIKKIKAENKENLNGFSVIDLCSGSGAIGLGVFKNLPTEYLVLNEIDESHHQTILKNIKKNDLDETKIKIIGGDLFSEIDTGQKFDYIFSNPPYIYSDFKSLDQSVSEYEPKLALDGGENGLDIIKKIIDLGQKYLKPKGVIFLEHDPWQEKNIQNLAREKGYVSNFHEDQYGQVRFCDLTYHKIN